MDETGEKDPGAGGVARNCNILLHGNVIEMPCLPFGLGWCPCRLRLILTESASVSGT